MKKTERKIISRKRRHARVRASVFGTAERPRLSVFRSNRYVRVQLIDDVKKNTIVAADDRKAAAEQVGKAVAEKAIKENIATVVFDRGGYKYHGIVKKIAEGARTGGLKF